MRVALIYHQFVPRGGLEGYLMEFAFRLRSEGHEVLVVTAEADEKVLKELKLELKLVPVLQGSGLVRLWQFERLVSQWSNEDLGVDVSIGFGRTTAHDLHRAGGGCHHVYSQLLPFWKRWSMKNLLELQLERELYSGGNTRLFVVNSSEVAKQVHAAYGTPMEQFRVIHTAVDTHKFKPAEDKTALRARICAQMKSDASRPAFLFVSLNHRRKGLDALLEAWENVDADLWIVGKPLDTRYRLQLAKYGLTGRVFALDARSDVGMLYQAADWFVHPTQYDACANTVLQSMACGLPGLISVQDGAIDFIRDGQNGFLLKRPQHAETLLGDLRKALAMGESERAALGRAARETVLPLTWSAHLAKWQAAIAEMREADE